MSHSALNQSPRHRELFFEETNFFRIHSNRILYLPPIPPLTLYFAATLHIVQSISISDRQHKDRCPHASVCRGLGLSLQYHIFFGGKIPFDEKYKKTIPYLFGGKIPFDGGALGCLELQDHGEEGGVNVPER